MRHIENIVFHCTAGPQNQSVEVILSYWRNVLGWKQVGYHYLIDAKGIIHRLAPESTVTNGVKGHNANSIHVSYIGGVDNQGNAVDNRTPAQIKSQIALLSDLMKRYPTAFVCGHRDFKGVTKKCPSFDVRAWLKALKIGL